MGLGVTDESTVVLVIASAKVDDNDFPNLDIRGLICFRAKLQCIRGIEKSTSAASKRGHCERWHGSTIDVDRRFPAARASGRQ